MGILAHTSCYLCGPVEADPDAAQWRNRIGQSLSEMDVIVLDPLKKPQWVGDRILRPQADINKAFFENQGKADKESLAVANEALITQFVSRDMCLRMVRASNWCICRLPKIFTVGTFEELTDFSHAGAPVMFICPDGIPSMWLVSMFVNSPEEMGDVFFRDESSLLEHLLAVNTAKKAIDPKKWIFLTWTQWKEQK